MKNKLLFFLAFLWSAWSFGQEFTDDGSGINYEVSSNVAPLTVFVSYNSDFVGDASIPETVVYDKETYAVIGIYNDAFKDNAHLTSVTIPNSVGRIDMGTFQNCINLTSVTIPNSVSSIGSAAFQGCSSLASITIPDSVTSIGGNAFNECSSLTSVTIPNSVSSIGSAAFQGCSSLASITIPDSVTNIGKYTFDNCINLASVTIPNSVIVIGEFAFEDCSSLASVTIPNSVISIGAAAFQGCSSLASVTIPDSVTSIGEGAFVGCSSLASVTIPDSVTSIKAGAFYGCSSLASVMIPNSITSIGEFAFGSCSNLVSVTIPDSVTSIGQDAFVGCSALTSVSVNWETPLVFDSVAPSFDFENLANITLHVPSGTTASYTEAGWLGFKSIVTSATHLNFDGVNDRIELDNSSNFNFASNFSIECWIQVSSFNKEWQTIISKGTDGPRIHRYGTTDFIAFGTGGQDDLKSNTSLNDGNWHHIAATFNNGVKTLYIDGVLDATQTVGSPLGVNGNSVRIGSQSDAYSPELRNFNGNIDEVRIWNVARTETEIKSSKNCELQGNETGLVAYYKFNQGAAEEDNTAIITLTDATSNANNGTLSGFENTGTNSNFLAGSPVRTGIAIPTAPKVDAQTFCETTTVASLVPAPSETTFWYADNTTTVALSSADTVITGTYYVATANANGCESARTAVDVTTLTAPTAYAQIFCGTTTVASLVPAPSETTFWYVDNTTTSALSDTDTIEAGTYYVATTNEYGCESARTAVDVTFSAPAVISVQPKNQTALGDQAITFTVTATDVTSYQWEYSSDGTEWYPLYDYFENPDVSGATSNVLTFSGDNMILLSQFKLRVVLNAEACSVASEEVTATVTDTTLGTSSFENTNFSYYPNPTNGILNIDNSKDIQQVTVFSMLGKLVQETKPNTRNAKVDLSSLAAGNYLVQVKTNEEIKTIKIVKK